MAGEVDIATLGIKVDATSADDAGNKLDNLANKAENTERATKGVTSATAEMRTLMAQAIAAINSNTQALGSNTDQLNRNKTASRGAAAAVDDMDSRVDKLRSSIDPMGAAIDRVNAELAEARMLFEAGAISANDYARAQVVLNARSADFARRQGMMNTAMGIGARSAKLQTHEMLNLSRQFADIGVTAMMGMNPLMILVQQGPQIADVLGTARARGISTSQAFLQMGESLKPFLSIITKVGVIAGIAFAALSLATRDLNKDVGDVQKEFGLTEKQMDRLKDKGTNLGFTLSDAFAGLKNVIVGGLTEAFGPEIETVKKWWNEFLDNTASGAVRGMKDVVGTFVGAFYAIKATWRMLPSAIGDLVIQAANLTIKAVEDMINFVASKINVLVQLANKGAELVGMRGRLGEIGQVSLGRVSNPFAGAASRAADTATGAFREGYEAGGRAVDRAGELFREGASRHRRDRILEDAGDAEKARQRRQRKPRESEEEKDYKRAIEGAENYIKALQKETEEIGKNRFEVKRLATEREATELMAAAMATGNAAHMATATKLVVQMREETEKWVKAQNAEGIRKFNEQLEDRLEAMRFEQSLFGKSAEEQAKANKTREIALEILALERDGYYGVAEAVRSNAHAMIELAGAQARWTDMADAADRTAIAARDMASTIRDATEGFGDLFGTAGEGFSDLMNVIFDYNARQEESYAHLIDLQRQLNQGQIDAATYNFEVARTQTEMANAQIANYGNMLHAAKGFFKEGSTGWKVMEAAERVYRLFQFAMMIRAMFMDKAQTASSVANSGARATADGIAAVAKAIASLPFPLNIAAGAATLAFLVAIGVKLFGGKGGAGKASAAAAAENDNYKNKDTYNGPRDQYGNPTSAYSVLRPGATTVAAGGPAWGFGGMAGGISFKGGDVNITVQGNMVSDTIAELEPVLQAHRQATVQDARQAVAADISARSMRQHIGGGS